MSSKAQTSLILDFFSIWPSISVKFSVVLCLHSIISNIQFNNKKCSYHQVFFTLISKDNTRNLLISQIDQSLTFPWMYAFWDKIFPYVENDGICRKWRVVQYSSKRPQNSHECTLLRTFHFNVRFLALKEKLIWTILRNKIKLQTEFMSEKEEIKENEVSKSCDAISED